MKTLLGFFLAMALVVLAACGEVVTPEATVARLSVSTPTSAVQPSPMLRPTATAPIIPPAATATPTVTPTPVVHVVEEGDTLLSIAFQYGVSVQALQTTNNIENPQYLQIGQRLVIPSGEDESGAAPGLMLPTPTPLPLGVRGVAFHETPVGSLWCLGEVVNTAAYTITNVQISVALFDAAGERLVQADVFAAADLIPPGERAPFGVLFTNPPSTWATPQVTIVRSEAAGALADLYVPIAVTSVEGQPSESQFQVSGTVQNVSTEQAAGNVYVIATSYDDQGLVTGFRQGIVRSETALASGASAPFTLVFNFHGDTPADFHVIALGRAPAE
jgi:LysM repeat protein